MACGLFRPMRQEPDRAAEEHPSFEDAERACAVLAEQIERARQVMRQYQVTLWAPGPDNDNRPVG